jgi:hypothetical protein
MRNFSFEISGKALVGLLEDMKQHPENWVGRKVLFVHTGGLLGMYDKMQLLQPMIGNWRRFHLPDSVPESGIKVGRMF